MIDDARKLEFIDWLTTPPHMRGVDGVPKSMEELADKLGVTSRTLRNWKADKLIRQAWDQEARAIVGSPERKQRVLDELYELALDREDGKQMKAADLYLKAIGAITPAAQEEATAGPSKVSELSDEQLAEMIAEQAQRILESRRG